MCVTDGRVGQIKLWVVEHVEQLSAKLYVNSLRDDEILEQRGIQIKTAGAAQDISSSIAKRIYRWGEPHRSGHIEGSIEPIGERGIR